MDDALWRKTTFDGRRPSVEDALLWKTTFVGRWRLVEDYMRWKTTFSGRQPLLDPFMLPTPLSGIFFMFYQVGRIREYIHFEYYISNYKGQKSSL